MAESTNQTGKKRGRPANPNPTARSSKTRLARGKSMAKEESKLIVNEEPYRLTFSRLLYLITRDSERKNGITETRYRDRFTGEPIRLSGQSTLSVWCGFPSNGSIRYYFDQSESKEVLPGMDEKSYVAIWLFLETIVDRQGKGLIDPIDPNQTEIRFADWKDVWKLRVEESPDAETMLLMHEHYWKDGFDLVKQLHRIQGRLDPIASLFQLVKRSAEMDNIAALKKLKRLILLYQAEYELSDREEIVDRMLQRFEDSKDKTITKARMMSAIDKIIKLQPFTEDEFAASIAPLSEHLQKFDGESFESIEELMNYVGWTIDND